MYLIITGYLAKVHNLWLAQALSLSSEFYMYVRHATLKSLGTTL
jgi:hypothetical protein